MCKDPVAGRSLECLMTLEKVSVTGGERKIDSQTDGEKEGERERRFNKIR